MFTQAIEKTIDSISDAKKTFVEQYFTEPMVGPATTFVEAQREFAKQLTRSTEEFTTTVQNTATKFFKV